MARGVLVTVLLCLGLLSVQAAPRAANSRNHKLGDVGARQADKRQMGDGAERDAVLGAQSRVLSVLQALRVELPLDLQKEVQDFQKEAREFFSKLLEELQELEQERQEQQQEQWQDLQELLQELGLPPQRSNSGVTVWGR